MRFAHILVSLPGIPTEKKKKERKEVFFRVIFGTPDDPN